MQWPLRHAREKRKKNNSYYIVLVNYTVLFICYHVNYRGAYNVSINFALLQLKKIKYLHHMCSRVSQLHVDIMCST